MDVVNTITTMSKRELHRDEKCQLRATHGSSVNDKETPISQGRIQLAPKQHDTQAQQNSCPHVFQQHRSKSKNKTMHTEARTSDLGQAQKV